MKYLGHRVLHGPASWGKPTAFVYAQPERADEPWTQIDPARLKDAPFNFNASDDGNAPTFRRPHIMLDPAQMRLDETTVQGQRLLVLQAIPIPGVEGIVGMRRLNNYALQFSQMCGYFGWCIILRHVIDNPIQGSIPQSDPLPAPTDRKAALQIIKGEDAANNILSMGMPRMG